MHNAAWAFVAGAVSSLDLTGDVLEIGSRDVNGTVRSLFRDARSYTGIDVSPGPGVDVAADGASFDPGTNYDVVVCCEVLEHARDAAGVIANALRLLKPGGKLIVTCAGPTRVPHSNDGGALKAGEYYRNVYADDVARWAAGHEAFVRTTPDYQDLYAVIVKGG